MKYQKPIYSAKPGKNYGIRSGEYVCGMSSSVFVQKMANSYSAAIHFMKRDVEDFIERRINFPVKDKNLRICYTRIKRTPRECSYKIIYNILLTGKP